MASLRLSVYFIRTHMSHLPADVNFSDKKSRSLLHIAA